MPLKLTGATKAKVKPQVVETGDPVVDEFAELLAWDEKHRKHAKSARLKELKAQFQKEADEQVSDDAEATFTGDRFIITLGAKSNDRFVADKEKLLELIGQETFMTLATFAVGKVDDLLTGEQKKEVFDKTRGSRSAKVEARPLPKPKPEE